MVTNCLVGMGLKNHLLTPLCPSSRNVDLVGSQKLGFKIFRCSLEVGWVDS